MDDTVDKPNWKKLLSKPLVTIAILGGFVALASVAANLLGAGTAFDASQVGALTAIWIGLCLAWAAFAILRRFATKELEPDFYLNEPHQAALASVVRQLRKRARALRLAAWATLVIMILTIAAGMFLFSSADIAASRAQSEKALFEQERLIETLYELSARQMVMRRDLEAASLSGDSDEIENLRRQAEVLDALISDLGRSIESGIQPSDQESETGNVVFVVSSLSTKLGSVLLLLFLAKILINLYRYSLQLAAFYDSRADCIQSSRDDSAQDLNDYLLFFSTDNLRFGVTPQAPTEQAMEMAKEIAIAMARNRSG